jgi:hypothetical protein
MFEKAGEKGGDGTIMEMVSLLKVHCTHMEFSQWKLVLLMYANSKIKNLKTTKLFDCIVMEYNQIIILNDIF